MLLAARNPDLDYVNPENELNAGIWTLYASATTFLAARVWTKLFRRHGLWFDDYILLTAWVCASCRVEAHGADQSSGHSDSQRHHHIDRVYDWLCHCTLGRSDAYSDQHHLVWDSSRPEPDKDCVCRHSAQTHSRFLTLEGLPLRALVLHREHVRLQPC